MGKLVGKVNICEPKYYWDQNGVRDRRERQELNRFCSDKTQNASKPHCDINIFWYSHDLEYGTCKTCRL